MFCPKCGNQVADSAKFCKKCGNKLAAQQPVQEIQYQQPMQEPQGRQLIQEQQTEGQEAVKKRSKAPLIIVPVAAVVAIAAFLIVFFVVLSPKRKYDKAVELFNKGEYKEARAIFYSLGDYENSADYCAAIRCEAGTVKETKTGGVNGKKESATYTFEYDENGNIILETYAEDDNVYSYEDTTQYDEYGNTLKRSITTHYESSTSVITIDHENILNEKGWVISSVETYDGDKYDSAAVMHNEYTYYDNGRLHTHESDGIKAYELYSYDDRGFVQTEVSRLKMGSDHYTEDTIEYTKRDKYGAELQRKETDQDGRTVTFNTSYEYDDDGNIVKSTETDSYDYKIEREYSDLVYFLDQDVARSLNLK